MRIKWETLKEKAILAAVGNVPYCYERMAPYAILEGIADGSFDWKKNVELLRKKCIQIIDGWDVRCVKKLIELFPSIVPQKYVNAPIRCYIADDGNYDWIVEIGE